MSTITTVWMGVLLVVWSGFTLWIMWKVVDDIPVWTRFSKRAILRAMGLDFDEFGQAVNAKAKPLSQAQADLAGRVAQSLATVLASVVIGSGIFFGAVLMIVAEHHEKGIWPF